MHKVSMKVIAGLAALVALSAIPRVLVILPETADYRMGYSLLIYLQALAGLSIVAGSALVFMGRFAVAQYMIGLGCCVAAFGKVVDGYIFEYPLPLTSRLGYFFGAEIQTNGYTLHIPFLVLAIAMAYVSHGLEEPKKARR